MVVNAGLVAEAHYQNSIKCSSDNHLDSVGYEGDSRMGEKVAFLNRSNSSVGFGLRSYRLHSNEKENQEFSRKVLLACL